VPSSRLLEALELCELLDMSPMAKGVLCPVGSSDPYGSEAGRNGRGCRVLWSEEEAGGAPGS